MKIRPLFLAGIMGLCCGLLFKWRVPDPGSRAGNPMDRRAAQLMAAPGGSQLPQDSAGGRNWESRLSPYLTAPLPPAPAPGAAGPRAAADALLRLLRQPVTDHSIREGIALLNADAPERYYEFAAAVFGRWAREAPEAALAAAEGLRDPRHRTALVWKIFEAGAAEPDILAKAMAQPAGVNRSAAFAALAETVSTERAVEMLRESMKGRQPGGMDDSIGTVQVALFNKFRKNDPGMPLRLALETDDPAWRTALLKTASIGGGGPSGEELSVLIRDPQNVEGLKNKVWSKTFFRPEEGLKALAGLPEAERREVTAGVVGLSIEMLTAERFREQAAKDNRAGKLDDLLKEVEKRDGVEGTRAVLAESALARGTQGLDETASWMRSRRDAVGLEDLTRRAAAAEPFTTARWLAAMPPSADRDRAVAVFAETHAAVDPERAAVWAASIADAAQRAAALAAVKRRAGHAE